MFSPQLVFCSKITTHSQEINSICFVSKKKLLASASKDKTIRIWSLKADINHDAPIKTVAFSPNNKILATGWEQGKISLFNPKLESPNLLQDLLT